MGLFLAGIVFAVICWHLCHGEDGLWKMIVRDLDELKRPKDL